MTDLEIIMNTDSLGRKMSDKTRVRMSHSVIKTRGRINKSYYREPDGIHCVRCSILFSSEEGGAGDGSRCDSCLNELGII